MKLRCALCSLICAGLMVSVSLAQPPGGGRQGGMMGGGLTALAKAKDVAADLKLTEDQTKKLDELDKKMSEKRRSAMQDNQGDREGMMAAMQEIAKETEKGLGEAISADQLKRLKQLQLQSSIKNGGLMMALGNPDVSKALKFNEEQQEQLRGFREDMQSTMREMFQNAGEGDRAEMQKKMQEFRASMDKKVSKLLTEDQQKALKDLQGEPFKGEFPAMGMGGGRGKRK